MIHHIYISSVSHINLQASRSHVLDAVGPFCQGRLGFGVSEPEVLCHFATLGECRAGQTVGPQHPLPVRMDQREHLQGESVDLKKEKQLSK